MSAVMAVVDGTMVLTPPLARHGSQVRDQRCANRRTGSSRDQAHVTKDFTTIMFGYIVQFFIIPSTSQMKSSILKETLLLLFGGCSSCNSHYFPKIPTAYCG
uniref:Secreted protein n=1 Tax=Panagrellus redivivus TaxID=6233 RepID=A0A7E4UWY2_PANRE